MNVPRKCRKTLLSPLKRAGGSVLFAWYNILPSLKRWVGIIMTTGRYGVQNYIHFQSAALTYYTVLSLVPLLAVVFSFFDALGGVELLRSRIQEQIFEYIVAGNRQQVSDYFSSFLANINPSALGIVGFSTFFVITILLLHHIETAFNQIWRAKRRRPILRKIVLYGRMLLFGTLMISFYVTLKAAVLDAHVVSWLLHTWPIVRVAIGIIPVAILCLFFAICYRAIPQDAVSWRVAIFAGTLAGISLDILKILYSWIAVRFFTYHVIYGSLGAIPVLIIWFNWAWTIILYGAQLSFVLQHPGKYVDRRR